MLISFYNASDFLTPEDDGKLPILDGYTIAARLPAQLDPDLEDLQTSSQQSLKAFSAGNIVINILLRASLNTLFSSMNSLQITAHLPLINIEFSSSSYLLFDIIIQFVVFEFLPMHLVNFGFQETDYWSEQLRWLSYDSGNYIELLGSLGVFFLFLVL